MALKKNRKERRAITYTIHPESLRYGENPNNIPAHYLSRLPESKDLLASHRFTRIEGKMPGFINIIDVDRAVETISRIAAGFEKNFGKNYHRHIAVIVKHGNACGAAVQNSAPLATIGNAIDGDADAAFGGVVITNFPIGLEEANTLLLHRTHPERKRIFDMIIAPHFSLAAIELLRRPRGGCILLENPALSFLGWIHPSRASAFGKCGAGLYGKM